MNMKKIHKKIATLAVALTIGINSILIPTNVIASEEYRIEFFNQIADKINSLYYKETVVGIDIMNEIYGNEDILNNIKSELNNNPETKSYLESEGFTFEKISEIIRFVDRFFPDINELLDENNKDLNFLGKLVRNIFVDKSKSIDYIEYDDSIKDMGKELYDIMPDEFKLRLDNYSTDEESRINAMIKIMVEFMYSGHGTAIYDKITGELIDLELKAKDDFLENTNQFLNIGLNDNDKKGIDLILKGIEKTIKQEELETVYSDISSVINILDTKVNEDQPISITNRDIDAKKDITRAEVLEVFLNFYNIELVDYGGEFNDVSQDDYYAKYIGTAKNIGLINGYEDNTFRPNSNITRAEVAVVLGKILENHVEEPTEEQIDMIIKNFKDSDDIAGWAKSGVAKIFITGIMIGKSENEYRPNDNITFGEIFTIIDRLKYVK